MGSQWPEEVALQFRRLGSERGQRQYCHRAHCAEKGRQAWPQRLHVSCRAVRRGSSYEQPISKIGHRLCQNNTIVFENCRVPQENVFAEGNGGPHHRQGFHFGQVRSPRIAAVGVARSAL